MAAQDGSGERRRTRSLDERKRIVEEALAPGASVAAVARRHEVNANLIFKWIRRSREGWRDRRREPTTEQARAVAAPEAMGPAFVPVKLLELQRRSVAAPAEVERSRRGKHGEPHGAARWRSACRTAPRCRSMPTSTPNAASGPVGAGHRLMLPVRAGGEVYRPASPSICGVASGHEGARLSDFSFSGLI